MSNNNFPSAGRLLQQMDLVANRMGLDFDESSQINHSGSKGTVRERQLVRSFLEKYVSRSATVIGSGELIATGGQVSTQFDVMIVDNDTPPLFKSDEYSVVPIECCFVTIEVKSNLTVLELQKSWAAAKKAKTMPRTAYASKHPLLGVTQTAHGRTWQHAGPLRSIVFAYEGATLDTLAREMSQLATEDTDPAIGIDALFVLDRGIVSWHTLAVDQLFDRLPESIVFASPATPGNVLLFMMSALNEIVATAQMNDRVDLRQYVTQSSGQIATWWDAGEEVPVLAATTPEQN